MSDKSYNLKSSDPFHPLDRSFKADPNWTKKIIRKVMRTVFKYNMIRHGDRVVVGVSGGADSVCLLDVLNELKDSLGIELVAAHLDHGLRPDADRDETKFVESLAASLDLPFETKEAGPGLREGVKGLEERARQTRYRFFEELRKKTSSQKIATGHNLNDQAETVLMRLLRGSGPAGLAGIPPCRDQRIIRPLIEVTRNEIESYLKCKQIAYMTDSSNLETRYLRNKIRLDLLPKLKEYQPRIVEILGHTAETIRGEDEWLEATAEKWLRESAETMDNGGIKISLPLFKGLSAALRNRVIRYALRITGGDLLRVSLCHIEAVDRAAMGKRPQAQVNLPNRLTAGRVYDRLVFARVKDKIPEGFNYTLKGPGTFHLRALNRSVSVKEIESWVPLEIKSSPWTAFLNADRITYPLAVRNFRAGDRFIPFGMRGHKKIKDLFIDLKIPSEARASTPILVHQNTPIWVCGLRIDDRFRVSPDTRRVLKVTFRECT
ncbi:MAG: tRNA lysidine(34) synthetase TilS [Thermodesulfobacteriota bacterium]|nr:tRNA lysidine(34) synthetase TilS [Thermodesulfobacteriota bacterium]